MLSRALLDYRIGFDFKHIFFAEQIIKSYLLGIYCRGLWCGNILHIVRRIISKVGALRVFGQILDNGFFVVKYFFNLSLVF